MSSSSRRSGPTSFKRRKWSGAESALGAAGRGLAARGAGVSISTSCSRSATRAPRRSSSPRPAIRPAGWRRRAEQQAMLDFARERGIAIISDEVYGTLVYDGSTHAPSFLQIAGPRRRGLRHQQLLQALGDDGLAHRLAGASAILDEPMRVLSPANNTGTDHLRAVRRARRAVAARAMRSATRLLRALPRRARRGAGFHRPPEPHPLDQAGGRLLRLPAHRRPDTTAWLSRKDLVLRANVGVAPGSAFGLGDPRDDAYVRDLLRPRSGAAWPKACGAIETASGGRLNRLHR